jgi:hypothetical protein
MNIWRLIMRIKGQTAMEYLMTYGWAILIIIVVVAALYAMGVFSVKSGVSCSPCFSYFAYRDYDKTSGTVFIRNGARTINITTVTGGTAPAECGADCTSTNACDPGADVSITGVGTAGDQQIAVTYCDCGTGVCHDDTAKIHN